jgi:hypothetical protein
LVLVLALVVQAALLLVPTQEQRAVVHGFVIRQQTAPLLLERR